VRYGEKKFPDIPPWKKSLLICLPLIDDPAIRSSIGESMGPHFKGALSPGPCPDDTPTMVAGVLGRFGSETPAPDLKLFGELREFARWFMKKEFSPVPAGTDVSVEAWLANCENYSARRKAELIDCFYAISERMSRRNLKVKSFPKDERYPTWKHVRGINSRSDPFKCMVGPYFKLIEKVFYAHQDFIKKIPVSERPEALFQKLFCIGVPVQCMDFKKMESHFTKFTFELEFDFYEYMTQFLDFAGRFMEEVRGGLTGMNYCHFKKIIVALEATRMSGEMNTSLGNAYVNWILSKFFAWKNGCLDVHRGFFEGDDSAVVSPYIPTVSDYASVGFKIEMSCEPTVETASFCGLVFDPVERVNVTDPLKFLTTFGWTNRRYVGAKRSTQLSLLRCKALSLVWQFQGCPIISALGRYGLRVTKHVDFRRVLDTLNEWEKGRVKDSIKDLRDKGFEAICNRPVGMRTRLLMERVFRISVDDQLFIEDYLNNKNDLCPIDCPRFMKYMPKEWTEYYDEYVLSYPKIGFNRRLYRSPDKVWSKIPGFKPAWDDTLFVSRAELFRRSN